MATAEALMSAEEFGRRPDPGHPEELVQGRVIDMPPADRRHGQICGQAYFLLRLFVEQHRLGHVLGNDSGVITGRDPDSVRGADVAYYSYARLPEGPLPIGYGPEAPEIVFEVRSAHDRWRDILEKVLEYLDAGVAVVVVLDPKPQVAHVFAADEPPRTLEAGDDLTFPGLLDGFSARVGRFFG